MSTTPTKVNTTAIRTPTNDVENHTTVLRQLKETTEVAQRLRGDPGDSFVRVSELVAAGIVRLVNGTVQPPSTNAPPGSAVPSSRNVNTADSITGGGNLGADLTLQLSGDSASPGNNMLYGTNGSGVRGWYTQATGLVSPLTTKGDLWGFSSSNARVPVGADGTVLTADSTQTTGIKWGSGSSGSYTQLAQTKLLSSASSVAFNSISGAYSNLIISVVAFGTAAAVGTVGVQFNGDTAANYDFGYVFSTSGPGVSSISAQAQTVGTIGFSCIAGQPPAVSKITVFNYAAASGMKSWAGNGWRRDTTTGTQFSIAFGGSWRGAAAINSILVSISGSLFAAGSVVTLYGEL